MNYIGLIKKIRNSAMNTGMVHSVYVGDVYSNWNNSDVKYSSFNIGLENIVNNSDTVTYNLVLYYADRLLQDKSNVNAITVDAYNTIQSTIKSLDDSIEYTSPITVTPFEQNFADYLAGGYARVQITTEDDVNYCGDSSVEPAILNITENGYYNVLDYDSAVVDVITKWGTIEGDITTQEDLIALIPTIEQGENITITKTDNNYKFDVPDMSYDDTEIKEDIAEIQGDITGINGSITTINGNITTINGEITDIQGDITDINGEITDIKEDVEEVKGLNEVTIPTIVNTTTNFTSGSKWTITTAFERVANLFGGIMEDIKTSIKDLIPTQASSTNQLADKAFVNATIAENAANFRGNWATWTSVPTDKNQYPADYSGSKEPTNNDYLVVQDASGYDAKNDGAWRFKYTGDWDTVGKSGWSAEYRIGSAFTEAQQKAIDSTITSEKVTAYDAYESRIGANETNKVDKINTSNKIYGTSSDGTQTGYELGDNLSISNGKINATDTVYDDTEIKTQIAQGLIKFYKPTGVAAKTSSPYCCSQWVIADEEDFVPFDGMTIKVRIPVAGNGSYGTCIKVNNELHPVVYNVNSAISTRYGVNGTITLTYNATQTATAHINSKSASTITGCWQMEDYDTTNTFQLKHNSGSYKASADIKRYKVCVTDKDGVGITPLSDGSSTSGHNYCTSFNPFGQILYLSINTTNAYAKDEDVSASALYNQTTFDMRYTFNGGTTMLTANKDVYLKCTHNADGTFNLLGLTQEPLSDIYSYYFYIYLGHSYSAYQIEMHPEHKIYYYHPITGTFTEWDGHTYKSDNTIPIYSVSSSDSNIEVVEEGDYDEQIVLTLSDNIGVNKIHSKSQTLEIINELPNGDVCITSKEGNVNLTSYNELTLVSESDSVYIQSCDNINLNSSTDISINADEYVDVVAASVTLDIDESLTVDTEDTIYVNSKGGITIDSDKYNLSFNGEEMLVAKIEDGYNDVKKYKTSLKDEEGSELLFYHLKNKNNQTDYKNLCLNFDDKTFLDAILYYDTNGNKSSTASILRDNGEDIIYASSHLDGSSKNVQLLNHETTILGSNCYKSDNSYYIELNNGNGNNILNAYQYNNNSDSSHTDYGIIVTNGNNELIDAGERYYKRSDNNNYTSYYSYYKNGWGNDLISNIDYEYTNGKRQIYTTLHNGGYSDLLSSYVYYNGKDTTGELSIYDTDGSDAILIQRLKDDNNDIKTSIKLYSEELLWNNEPICKGGGELPTKTADLSFTIDELDSGCSVRIVVQSDVERSINDIDGFKGTFEETITIDYKNPIVHVHIYGLGNIEYQNGFWFDRDNFYDGDYFNQDLLPCGLSVDYFHSDYDVKSLSFTINLKDLDDGDSTDVCRITSATMCYAEGTLITLADGTTKAVEDITYDDVLKVWNFDNGSDDSEKPLWIKREQIAHQYMLVTLSDGNSIKLVGNDGKYHCMYDVTEQKFNHAIDCIGHQVYTENGIVTVTGMEPVYDKVKYYNIVTNVHMNCYANHILTSTEKNNIYAFDNMKFVKDDREIKPYSEFEKYGITIEEYNGWRLGEQPMKINECVNMVMKRRSLMKKK